MLDVHLIVRMIILMTAGSGALAIAVSIAGSMTPILEAGQLIGVFVESFRLGVAALVGLIVGRSAV